jgi:hypothetical protein
VQIEPVQRIPRYRMLLEEARKHTPAEMAADCLALDKVRAKQTLFFRFVFVCFEPVSSLSWQKRTSFLRYPVCFRFASSSFRARFSSLSGQNRRSSFRNSGANSTENGRPVVCFPFRFKRCTQAIEEIGNVRENGIFEPFIYKNEHFAKTGSGQT